MGTCTSVRTGRILDRRGCRTSSITACWASRNAGMPSPLWSGELRARCASRRKRGATYTEAYRAELSVNTTSHEVSHSATPAAAGSAEEAASEGLSALGKLMTAGRGTADDMVDLDMATREAVATNIEQRYMNEAIYTNIGPVLVAVNPNRWLNEYYDPALMRLYARRLSQGVGGEALPPHIFTVAIEAFRGLTSTTPDHAISRANQAIVISGESGSGKTEAAKKCMSVVLALASEVNADGCVNSGAVGSGASLDQRVLSAQPILEAFGNASTLRNSNSSRFGKWVELCFDDRCRVLSCSTIHYLLEKNRVVHQAPRERSYHVLHQLAAAAPPDDLCEELKLLTGTGDSSATALRTELALLPPERFAFLAGLGESGIVGGVDDADDFDHLMVTMSAVGFAPRQLRAILRLLASVLHLGNICFTFGCAIGGDTRGASGAELGCHVSEDDTEATRALSAAERLLGLVNQPGSKVGSTLEAALTRRHLNVGSEEFELALQPAQAIDATQSLAKAVYSRLFDKLVKRINALTAGNAQETDSLATAVRANPDDGASSNVRTIGALDIYGFEIFERNSFEQLCINYCNEVLQQAFMADTFATEEQLYRDEGILYEPSCQIDNSDVLALFESRRRPLGIFPLLDESALLALRQRRKDASMATGSSSSIIVQGHSGTSSRKEEIMFLNKLRDNQADHARLRLDPHSRGFTVQHYAAEVTYALDGMVTKNMDALSPHLVGLMVSSSDDFLARLFEESGTASPAERTMQGRRRGPGSASQLQSQTAVFQRQLQQLMSVLRSSMPHYIRCVKPNRSKQPLPAIDQSMVREQLVNSGVCEAVHIQKLGFPHRLRFDVFEQRYFMLEPSPRPPRPHHGDDGVRAGGTVARLLARLKRLPTLHTVLGKQGCQIGATMVFYQGEQNRALERLRNEVLAKASIICQSLVRSHQSRCLVRVMRAVRKELRAALKSRALNLLEQARGRAEQMMTEVMPFPFEMREQKEVYQLIERLHAEMASHTELDGLRQRGAPRTHVQYTELIDALKRAEDLQLEQTVHDEVRGGSIHIVAQLEHDARARMAARSELLRGLRTADKHTLHAALVTLAEEGLADGGELCSAEVGQATALLQHIEGEERALQLLEAALMRGCIVRDATSSCGGAAAVDARSADATGLSAALERVLEQGVATPGGLQLAKTARLLVRVRRACNASSIDWAEVADAFGAFHAEVKGASSWAMNDDPQREYLTETLQNSNAIEGQHAGEDDANVSLLAIVDHVTPCAVPEVQVVTEAVIDVQMARPLEDLLDALGPSFPLGEIDILCASKPQLLHTVNRVSTFVSGSGHRSEQLTRTVDALEEARIVLDVLETIGTADKTEALEADDIPQDAAQAINALEYEQQQFVEAIDRYAAFYMRLQHEQTRGGYRCASLIERMRVEYHDREARLVLLRALFLCASSDRIGGTAGALIIPDSGACTRLEDAISVAQSVVERNSHASKSDLANKASTHLEQLLHAADLLLRLRQALRAAFTRARQRPGGRWVEINIVLREARNANFCREEEPSREVSAGEMASDRVANTHCYSWSTMRKQEVHLLHVRTVCELEFNAVMLEVCDAQQRSKIFAALMTGSEEGIPSAIHVEASTPQGLRYKECVFEKTELEAGVVALRDALGIGVAGNETVQANLAPSAQLQFGVELAVTSLRLRDSLLRIEDVASHEIGRAKTACGVGAGAELWWMESSVDANGLKRTSDSDLTLMLGEVTRAITAIRTLLNPDERNECSDSESAEGNTRSAAEMAADLARVWEDSEGGGSRGAMIAAVAAATRYADRATAFVRCRELENRLCNALRLDRLCIRRSGRLWIRPAADNLLELRSCMESELNYQMGLNLSVGSSGVWHCAALRYLLEMTADIVDLYDNVQEALQADWKYAADLPSDAGESTEGGAWVSVHGDDYEAKAASLWQKVEFKLANRRPLCTFSPGYATFSIANAVYEHEYGAVACTLQIRRLCGAIAAGIRVRSGLWASGDALHSVLDEARNQKHDTEFGDTRAMLSMGHAIAKLRGLRRDGCAADILEQRNVFDAASATARALLDSAVNAKSASTETIQPEIEVTFHDIIMPGRTPASLRCGGTLNIRVLCVWHEDDGKGGGQYMHAFPSASGTPVQLHDTVTQSSSGVQQRVRFEQSFCIDPKHGSFEVQVWWRPTVKQPDDLASGEQKDNEPAFVASAALLGSLLVPMEHIWASERRNMLQLRLNPGSTLADTKNNAGATAGETLLCVMSVQGISNATDAGLVPAPDVCATAQAVVSEIEETLYEAEDALGCSHAVALLRLGCISGEIGKLRLADGMSSCDKVKEAIERVDARPKCSVRLQYLASLMRAANELRTAILSDQESSRLQVALRKAEEHLGEAVNCNSQAKGSITAESTPYCDPDADTEMKRLVSSDLDLIRAELHDRALCERLQAALARGSGIEALDHDATGNDAEGESPMLVISSSANGSQKLESGPGVMCFEHLRALLDAGPSVLGGRSRSARRLWRSVRAIERLRRLQKAQNWEKVYHFLEHVSEGKFESDSDSDADKNHWEDRQDDHAGQLEDDTFDSDNSDQQRTRAEVAWHVSLGTGLSTLYESAANEIAVTAACLEFRMLNMRLQTEMVNGAPIMHDGVIDLRPGCANFDGLLDALAAARAALEVDVDEEGIVGLRAGSHKGFVLRMRGALRDELRSRMFSAERILVLRQLVAGGDEDELRYFVGREFESEHERKKRSVQTAMDTAIHCLSAEALHELSAVRQELQRRDEAQHVMRHLRDATTECSTEKLGRWLGRAVELGLQSSLTLDLHVHQQVHAAQVLYQKLCECRAQLHMAIEGGRLPELEDALRYATTLRFREDPQQRAQLLAADALALEAEAGLALERLDLQRLREVRDDAHRLGVSLASRAAIARLLQLPTPKVQRLQLQRAVQCDDEKAAVALTMALKTELFKTPSLAERFSLERFCRLREPATFGVIFGGFNRDLARGMLSFVADPLHTSLTKLPRVELEAEARRTFMRIQGFMGDVKYPHPEALLEQLLVLGSMSEELRDELYCQLMKQLRGNAGADSRTKGWRLFALFLSAFPPSGELENFVEWFLRERGKSSLVRALHVIVYRGAGTAKHAAALVQMASQPRATQMVAEST